jgi:hypothetical protein
MRHYSQEYKFPTIQVSVILIGMKRYEESPNEYLVGKKLSPDALSPEEIR